MNHDVNPEFFKAFDHYKAMLAQYPEANHLNAQDVAYELVASAKDISIATFQCFEGGNKLMIKAEIVANLIIEIQTKLEMIEAVLPLAFESEEA